MDENPLAGRTGLCLRLTADFVELPDDGRATQELWYSNVLAGVLRGALEMVQIQVEPHFVSDVLRGDAQTELRIDFVKMIEEGQPVNDE